MDDTRVVSDDLRLGPTWLVAEFAAAAGEAGEAQAEAGHGRRFGDWGVFGEDGEVVHPDFCWGHWKAHAAVGHEGDAVIVEGLDGKLANIADAEYNPHNDARRIDPIEILCLAENGARLDLFFAVISQVPNSALVASIWSSASWLVSL